MPTNEIRRIQRHFADVLDELRSRDTSGLEAPVRATRAGLVDALERYSAAGVFPRNLDFPARATPYFVDAAGVRCAVGHLMHLTGEDALVADIAANDNHARIRELAGDARLGSNVSPAAAALGAWLARVGLDVAEAARIQPMYCFPVVSCVCQLGSPEFVTGTVESHDASRNEAQVRVTAVYSETSPSGIGDVLTVPYSKDSGSVLIWFTPENAAGAAWPISGDRVEMDCGDGRPDLLTADVMAAWSSTECAATFRARDPNADLDTCEYDAAQRDDGCAGGTTSSFGLLGGVAALTWLRRSRRSALPDRTS